MREILFRGLDADSGIWCYGELSFDREKNPCIRFWTHTGYLVRKVIPDTVGQFTGFYDKNNRRIFEGDILGSRYDDIDPGAVSYELVRWIGNGWYIHEGSPDDDLCQGILTECSEVVGNIFENSELMEEG